ncbi:MAG TPA: TonB-dependent receptor [Lacunisphaera sp.]|jgi:vitamin B12 transporter
MKTKIPASLRRLFILAGVLPVVSAFAQTSETEKLPDYVFSATRTPAALTTTGSYVDTISAAELERMQVTTLQSALGGIPGAPAFASGARGAIDSLFMRGSNSNQTLFLVDGIRLNDPNTDYQVYLGGACVGACDSLEISHGPQSTLYGGEAMGGVISLTTQKGSGPERNTVSVEAGSFGTVQGTLSSQGGDAQSSYNFSAAGGTTQNDRPNNDFTSTTYALRLDRKLNAQIAVGGTYRGFIGSYGSPGDRFTNDPDDKERESNQLATVFATFTPTATFNSKVILGGQDRRYEAISPSSFGTSDTLVKNSRVVLDWQNTMQFGEQHKVTAGLTAEENHTVNTGFGQIDKHQQLLAFFAQDEWTPLSHVYLTAGLRNDDFDTFGHATTGRVTAAWLSSDSHWKIRGSYGTAFRAPAFLDLYGKESYYVGNPNLKPEKAQGWDAGVDYFIAGNRGIFSATWFDTRFRDLIIYDFGVFPGTTANVEKAKTQGLELAGKFSLPGAIDVRVAYTYLEADNLSEHIRLLRRPRNSGSIDVWHDLGNAFSLGVGVAFVSDRQDVDAQTFATIEGEDYTVARIYGAWKATSRITVKARIENLLNEKYEEVNGYPQSGFGAFGGVEYKF